MSRPNIVFYFSDQQRADTCGCYGQELDITPALDALADQGIRFENAFTPQPVCGPCRAIFQTGLYATTSGCFRNNIALPADVPTLGEYFTEKGYETAYVGKWHLASEGDLESKPTVDYHRKAVPLERRGGYRGFWRAADVLEFTSDGYGGYVFDENMEKRSFQGYRTDCITDFALEFLDTRNREKPFFLTVSHIEPHHQNDAGHYQGPPGSKERFRDCALPEDLQALAGDSLEEYPDYLGACEKIDWNLGRLIQKLKDQGIYEDTVILFTSDHGSHFRTRNRDGHLHGYDDYKRTGHDAALRVPLVIRGGRYLGGQVVDDLVSTGSIPRTLMAVAGIKEKSPMIGEDLIDVVQGQGQRDNAVFAQISESRVGRVVRTADYTYAVYAPDKQGGLHKDSDVYADDYMYDLRKDPGQLTNIVDHPDYAEAKEALREKLLNWIHEAEYQGRHNIVRIV